MSAANKKFKGLIFIGFFTILLANFPKILQAQTHEQLAGYSEMIRIGTAEVKRSALFELRNFKSESASRVALPALRDPLPIVRATATHTVVFLPKDEAVAFLSPMLKDAAPFVRRETALALGEVRSPNALRDLLTHLQNDKDAEVRTACAIALGKLGEVSAIPFLNQILSRKIKDKETFLRRAAAHSIGEIAQTIQQQIHTETTPESFLPEKYKKIAVPKYQKLTVAFPVFREVNLLLLRVLQNPKEHADVRREAAFALGEIGDDSAIHALQTHLLSPDYYLAEICKEALRKIHLAHNRADSDRK